MGLMMLFSISSGGRLVAEMQISILTKELAVQALVLVCGGGPNHEVIGFRYWRDPGPLVQYLGVPGPLGRFLGFWTTFGNAVYSFS